MNPVLIKLFEIFTKLQNKARRTGDRKLFFGNLDNKIDPTFRIGINNYLDISPASTLQIEANVYINESNYITVKKGAILTIGKNTYITRATIACLEKITIGENCILGEGLKIFDHNHRYNVEPFEVSRTEFNTAPITIGKNVWTGANCIILKGVTIGDNCIIGANVTLYKDVPPYSLVINKSENIIKSLSPKNYKI